MSKSLFDQRLTNAFKKQKEDLLSEKEKQDFRLKTLEDIFFQLGNKENRFIFYCPDIVVVNDIVKTIYDIALEVSNLGIQVVVLHEINGFRCKWLADKEFDLKYGSLNIEYVIQKVSKKSKKETHQYSFKPSDTIIVPDVFQEVFDNLFEVKLVQKVLLVTGYSGISALPNGSNYTQLGVSGFLFLEKKLKDDYEELFHIQNNSYLLEYKVDKKIFDNSNVKAREVYPVITISNIGNVKLSQQVINIFYNLYPNLGMFSFKLISRENYSDYLETLKHSCLHLILDEQLGFKKALYDIINMGVSVATFSRRELEYDKDLKEFVEMFNEDPFVIAQFLGQYCSFWLDNPSSVVLDEVKGLKDRLKLETYTNESFHNSVQSSFKGLQEERIKFFSSIKSTVEKEA